jgi:hypothetical protein
MLVTADTLVLLCKSNIIEKLKCACIKMFVSLRKIEICEYLLQVVANEWG